MTEKAERLLAEAMRLGDQQAAELARSTFEFRRLRYAVWRAIRALRTGRTNEALEILKWSVEDEKRF